MVMYNGGVTRINLILKVFCIYYRHKHRLTDVFSFRVTMLQKTHQIGYASRGRGEKELGLPVTPAALPEEQVTAAQVHRSLPGAKSKKPDSQ